jgi:hypothetical protein
VKAAKYKLITMLTENASDVDDQSSWYTEFVTLYDHIKRLQNFYRAVK